jgi:hypothetical protein
VLHARDRGHQRFGVALQGNAVEKAHGIDGDVDGIRLTNYMVDAPSGGAEFSIP